MATGYKLPDGRDFDDVFPVISGGGQTVGYKLSNGSDLGARYPAGNSGITTGYRNSSGVDLGALFGTGTLGTVTRTTDRDTATGCGREGDETYRCSTDQWRFSPSSALYVAGTSYQITSIVAGTVSASCYGVTCDYDDRGMAYFSNSAPSGRTLRLYIGSWYTDFSVRRGTYLYEPNYNYALREKLKSLVGQTVSVVCCFV